MKNNIKKFYFNGNLLLTLKIKRDNFLITRTKDFEKEKYYSILVQTKFKNTWFSGNNKLFFFIGGRDNGVENGSGDKFIFKFLISDYLDNMELKNYFLKDSYIESLLLLPNKINLENID